MNENRCHAYCLNWKCLSTLCLEEVWVMWILRNPRNGAISKLNVGDVLLEQQEVRDKVTNSNQVWNKWTMWHWRKQRPSRGRIEPGDREYACGRSRKEADQHDKIEWNRWWSWFFYRGNRCDRLWPDKERDGLIFKMLLVEDNGNKFDFWRI